MSDGSTQPPPAGSPAQGFFARWFAWPMDPAGLASVRISVALLGIFMSIVVPRDAVIPHGLTALPPAFFYPVLPTRLLFLFGPPSDALLDGLRWALLVGFVWLALGWRTRVASFVVMPLSLAYYGIRHSFGATFSLSAGFDLCLLIGAFSDWGDALSIDAWRRGTPGPSPRYGAPMRAIHAVLCVMFLVAALHKMIAEPAWLGHGILWRVLVDRNYVFWPGVDPPLRLWLIAHPGLSPLLEWSTLFFEGTFAITFFFPRLVPLYVLGGLSFHLGIYLALPPVSGLPYLPMYLAALPSARWFARGPRLPSRPSTPREALRDRLLVAGAVGCAILAAVAWNERWQRQLWPFTSMKMFTKHIEPDYTTRYNLYVVDGDHETPLTPKTDAEVPAIMAFINNWIDNEGVGRLDEIGPVVVTAVQDTRCRAHVRGGELRLYEVQLPFDALLKKLPTKRRTLVMKTPLPPCP